MRVTTSVHKALVPVLGRSLIQRNLETLLAEGFRDIVVAVSAQEPEIEAYVGSDGAALAGSVGATLACIKEAAPLGTIGAARSAIGGCDALLVVNVDNLTTLSLRALVDYHCQTKAGLTIACHSEACRIPFGQLIVEGGEVVDYCEKPAFPVTISSGIYVVSRAAAELIEPDRRFDITDLFRAVHLRGLRVSAFEHRSQWIDVNDASALKRAEELFR
jgi:D-glycero-D-manno-heptose 1,7-bisphosphate phosphatase